MIVSPDQIRKLEEKAKDIRVDIIKMLLEAGSGHTGGPLGMADIFKGDPYQYRVNVPGTISPKNWSLRLPLSLEELLAHPLNQQIRKMITDPGRI